MSLRAMIWAWNQTVRSATTKMILLKLADNTNDETGECHPKISTIAKHCECHRRTVERNLKNLQQMGFISIIHQSREGRKINSRYRLNLQKTSKKEPEKTTNLDTAQSRIDTAESPIRYGTESQQESVSITTKSIKGKNAKNKILSTEKKPHWLPQKILNDFIEYRRQIKKPLTKIGLERLFSKLETIRHQGGDPIESINNSILSGYQGVFHQQNKQGDYHGKNRDGYQKLEQANADNIRYIQQLDQEIEEIDRIEGAAPDRTGLCETMDATADPLRPPEF